jgi:peptidoglycan/xylan/chitin deacetylase (PgdA/CDA1 family)
MRAWLMAGAIVAGTAMVTTTALARPGERRATRPAPQLAITFDDLPEHGPLPAGETPLAVIQRIVAALKAADAPPVYGFVNAGNLAGGQSEAVLDAWRSAGNLLGNHGWSHANLADADAAAVTDQVVRGEPLISAKMQGRDWHWFRYPFLAEGNDAGRVAMIRAQLAARHYKVAAVTMSFGDYAWNAPYARCLARNDQAAIAALETRYLDAARIAATRARAMSNAANGRDIPYVLLMHIGAFDARMLPRLLKLYSDMGFRLVPLEQAEADPFYANARDPSLTGPSATLEQALKARGLPVPPVPAAGALPGDAICA